MRLAVPFAVAPTVHIALPCGDAGKDAAAKAFVEWLSSKEMVKVMAEAEWHTRTDIPQAVFIAPPGSTDEFKAEVESGVVWMTAMLAKYGVMNIGIGSTQYQNVRTLRATKLAEFMAGQSLGQALAEFQSEGNAFFK